MILQGFWICLAPSFVFGGIGGLRPDFGEFDAEKLKIFIQDSDPEGRFEINLSNQLRKVPKAGRNGV